jgi:hypothetical protein
VPNGLPVGVTHEQELLLALALALHRPEFNGGHQRDARQNHDDQNAHQQEAVLL